MSTPDVERLPGPRSSGGCPGRGPTHSRVWWWVVVAFGLQFAAWTAWLIIAAKQKVQEVPLATEQAR